MGPRAGRGVGGGVGLAVGARIPGLDDSKLLTAGERERVDVLIRRRALAVSVGGVDHAQVDRLGLLQARRLATPGAVAGPNVPAEDLPVDAGGVPPAPLPQMAWLPGDPTSPPTMTPTLT